MENLKYVIIDDDKIFSLWFKTSLAENFPNLEHISSHENTLEGLLQIHRQEPDLLFLDHYIDGMNGFDVLDLMKHNPKVIMVSSEKINPAQIDQYPNVIGFIEKPVNLEKLKSLLQETKLVK